MLFNGLIERVKGLSKVFKKNTEDVRFIVMSTENLKLKPTKEVKYLIWSLPARTTCPYATKHCMKSCYACKSQTPHFPSVITSRNRHLEESKSDDFVERMIFTISSHLMRPSYKAAKRIVIRVHESGDFYSEEYLEKWLEIADFFSFDKRLVFVAYTKSVRFLIGKKWGDNFVFRFSIWDDTEPEEIAIAEALGLPIYTAVECFTNESKREKCLCADCSTCFKCFNNKFNRLVCEIH